MSSKSFRYIKRLCRKAKSRSDLNCIVVYDPETLGDTYEEIVESLRMIGNSGCLMKIVLEEEKDDGGVG